MGHPAADRPARGASSESRGPERDGRTLSRWLPWILLVALVARLGFVVAFESLPSLQIGGKAVERPAERTLFPDSREYRDMARHILAGHGPILGEEARLARMPGYGYFLAALEWLFGPGLLAVRLVQVGVATAAVALVAALARRVFGQAEAVAAAALAAVYPFFVVYTGLILSETLFMALFLCGLVALARVVREEGWGGAALAGACFGLATLVRASLLPCVMLLAVGWAVWRRCRGRVLLRAGCLVGTCALALAPWVVRNGYATGGHLVLTTSRAGASLYEGLNPKADGGPMLNVQAELPRPPGLDEVERDRQLARAALRWAWAHPARAAWLAVVKLGRFWNPVPNAAEFRSPWVVVGTGVPYVLVMLVALGGLARWWREGRGGTATRIGRQASGLRRPGVALILLLPVGYHSILHMVFVGSIRYRVVVMPLVVVLAAHGLAGLRRPVTGQGESPLGRARQGDRREVNGDGD